MKLVEKPLLVAQWHTHVQPAMESPTWGRLLKSFFACNLQTYNFKRWYETSNSLSIFNKVYKYDMISLLLYGEVVV